MTQIGGPLDHRGRSSRLNATMERPVGVPGRRSCPQQIYLACGVLIALLCPHGTRAAAPSSPVFITTPPSQLYPNTYPTPASGPYLITVDFTDPDGRADLDNCYLRLSQGDSEDMNRQTMMWWPGNTCAQWDDEPHRLTNLMCSSTTIANGYRVTFAFKTNASWVPSMNVDYYAWAYDGASSSTHVKNNRNAIYDNGLRIADAWRANCVDSDGDGYCRQLNICEDSNTAVSSRVVGLILYVRPDSGGSATVTGEISAYTISGASPSDFRCLSVTTSVRSTYDFAWELYAGGDFIDNRGWFDGDVDISNARIEPASQDQPLQGNLQVTVQNQDGAARSDAHCLLYDANYQYLDEDRSADGSGRCTWAGLISDPDGVDYHVEAYYAGPSPFSGGEFWGARRATINGNQTTVVTLRRDQPFASSVVFKNHSTGQIIGPDFPVVQGTTIRAEVTVLNRSGSMATVRTRLALDRDLGGSYDFDQTSASQPIAGNGTRVFTLTYTPSAEGLYYRAVKTETLINDWAKTDGWDWGPVGGSFSIDVAQRRLVAGNAIWLDPDRIPPLDTLNDMAIRHLFVYHKIGSVEEYSNRYHEFILDAHSRDMTVHFVCYDESQPISSEAQEAINVALAYNAQHPEAVIDGLQLDVEGISGDEIYAFIRTLCVPSSLVFSAALQIDMKGRFGDLVTPKGPTAGTDLDLIIPMIYIMDDQPPYVGGTPTIQTYDWLVSQAHDCLSRLGANGQYMVGISSYDRQILVPRLYTGTIWSLAPDKLFTEGGSTTSLIDFDLSGDDNIWKDAQLWFKSGANDERSRTVSGFLSGAHLLSFSMPLPTSVAAGDEYRLSLLRDGFAFASSESNDRGVPGAVSSGRILEWVHHYNESGVSLYRFGWDSTKWLDVIETTPEGVRRSREAVDDAIGDDQKYVGSSFWWYPTTFEPHSGRQEGLGPDDGVHPEPDVTFEVVEFTAGIATLRVSLHNSSETERVLGTHAGAGVHLRLDGARMFLSADPGSFHDVEAWNSSANPIPINGSQIIEFRRSFFEAFQNQSATSGLIRIAADGDFTVSWRAWMYDKDSSYSRNGLEEPYISRVPPDVPFHDPAMFLAYDVLPFEVQQRVACCEPDLSTGRCFDDVPKDTCWDGGGAPSNSLCAQLDCLHRCEHLALPCDYCWLGTRSENNCGGSIGANDGCDCGCEAFDPDCGCETDYDYDNLCDDIDVCSLFPAPMGVDTLGRSLGDVDGDCDVDLNDYQFAYLSQRGPGVVLPCSAADLDGDCDADLRDLWVFQGNFTPQANP